MHIFTRIGLLVGVVGTVGILHAMVGILNQPSISNEISLHSGTDQVQAAHISTQTRNSSATLDSHTTITNNIYHTDTGNFYFYAPPIDDTHPSPQAEVFYVAGLLKSRFEVKINGPIARTRVIQQFENASAQWQDGVYVFPLPMGAAVDSLIMHVGDRTIVGEIQPKQTAQEMFEQAKQEGKRASLVSQVRPDIFKNDLSNIPPGAAITIELEYQQLLSYSDVGYELRLPTGIAPKYSPDTMTMEFPEVTPTAPIMRPVEIELEINMGLELERLESLHHPVKQHQINSVEYYLRTEGDELEDKMFVLRWQPKQREYEQFAHLSQHSVDGSYGLITLLAPDQKENQLLRDITFILDTSGSMIGDAMIQAQRALSVAINELSYLDRFNIIEFDSDANALWGSSSQATDANKLVAVDYLSTLEADGGTEMISALELAFELRDYRSAEPNRLQQIIFITDGSVANENEILTLIQQRINDSRLFTIGIGGAPNTYFMQEAATVGRGLATFIGDLSHVEQEIQRLLAKIKQPALTDIQITLQTDTADVEYFPHTIPDLYPGQPIHVFYRSSERTSQTHEINAIVTAKRTNTDAYDSVYRSSFERSLLASHVANSSGVDKQWAYAKIQRLMRRLHTSSAHGDDHQKLSEYTRAQVTDLAMKYHLVSDYTSLIAIDEYADEAARLRYQGQPHGQSKIGLHHLASTSTDAAYLRWWGVLIMIGALFAFAITSSRVFACMLALKK